MEKARAWIVGLFGVGYERFEELVGEVLGELKADYR